jgi:hypothetical protein
MKEEGSVAFLLLGLFMAAVLTTLFFVLKKHNISPAPVYTPIVTPAPSVSPAPRVSPAPTPSPRVSPAPTPSPVFGSIIPSTPAPAPSPIVAQVRANTPAPSTPPSQSLPAEFVAFLNSALSALLSEETAIQLGVDLALKGEKSIIFSLLKSLSKKISQLGELSKSISQTIAKRWAERTMTGSMKFRFPSLDVLKRARLGLSWGKESTKLGENTAKNLKSVAGRSFDVAGALTDAGVRIATSAGRLATAGAKMAMSMATDPIMVAMVVGMALDSKNVGNFAQLSQTSDLLLERNNQLKDTYNATIDCYSWPPGPTCPPSPAPSPTPARSPAPSPGPAPSPTPARSPAPSPGPAPSPKPGRWPQFFGPHDLVDYDVLFADMKTRIYSLIADPGDPHEGFKATIDLIAALPQTGSVPGVLSSLTSLFNSINYLTGTADPVMAPFIWAKQDSQRLIQSAATNLNGVPGTDRIIARLNLLLAMQGIVSNYILQIIQNGGQEIDISTFTTLVMTPLPDSLIKALVDVEMDQDCLNSGGIVFNPGNGWDSHTCTWATKEDCHGSFPWVNPDNTIQDDLTPNTTKLLCMTTCPAPSPAGSPGPAPQIPCPAPSPCPAIRDPSTKANMTYTEWRNKDWFSRANLVDTGGKGAWNANLDKNAIPVGGACIIGDAGFHQFCEKPQTVGLCNGQNPSAHNKYDRTTGTCVNTAQLCQIKGVSFAPNLAASLLGPGDIEGSSYPSCYVSGTQHAASALVGDTIMRFYSSTATACINFDPIPNINSGDPVVNAVVNGITQNVLNPIGQGLTTFASDVEAGILQAVGALATGVGYVIDTAVQANSQQNVQDTINSLSCVVGAGSCSTQLGDSLCTGNPAFNGQGRTKYFSLGNRFQCCKPTQTVDSNGNCKDVCRSDQVQDLAGGCTCAGTAKPIDFGTYCGTTADCPACPSGQRHRNSWDCSCDCPDMTWNYNGQCISNTQCPSGYWVKSGVLTVGSINDCTPVVAGQNPPPKLLDSYGQGNCTFDWKLGNGSNWSVTINKSCFDASALGDATAQANIQNNKVDCQLNDWTDTSQCGTGGCNTTGTKTQSTTVKTQPSGGGSACPPLTRTTPCANSSCPGTSSNNPCPYGLSLDGVNCNSSYPDRGPNSLNNTNIESDVLIKQLFGQITGYCAPGQYLGPTGTNCYYCPINTYQPYNNITKNGNICAPCPPGKTAVPGSASCQ